MHFVDIAVASGYAALCLSVVLLMSPTAATESALEATGAAKLDSAMLSFVQGVGLPSLGSAPASSLCSKAAGASNSTLLLDVVVDGSPCPGVSPPQTFSAHSSLLLDLPLRNVTVEAWLAPR